MSRTFNFLYVDIWFDVPKCKILGKLAFYNIMVATFSPIVMADTGQQLPVISS